jgi:exonuclease VII small subunit
MPRSTAPLDVAFQSLKRAIKATDTNASAEAALRDRVVEIRTDLAAAANEGDMAAIQDLSKELRKVNAQIDKLMEALTDPDPLGAAKADLIALIEEL